LVALRTPHKEDSIFVSALGHELRPLRVLSGRRDRDRVLCVGRTGLHKQLPARKPVSILAACVVNMAEISRVNRHGERLRLGLLVTAEVLWFPNPNFCLDADDTATHSCFEEGIFASNKCIQDVMFCFA